MFVAMAFCSGFYRCSAPEYQHDRVLILRCAAPFGVVWLCGFYKHYRCAAPGFFNFHHFAILIELAAAPRNVCSNCRLPGFL